MRNYWIKIAAGAFGIFAVGMLLITGVRSVKSKVTQTLNSTDPIPLPLIGMVPFRLDDQQLGNLSKLEILRSDPQHVSGVRVIVRLADSVSPERLKSCVLALDDVDNINDKTTFRCNVTDQAGLERFGTVIVRGSSDSFPLLLPAQAVADLRSTEFNVSGRGVHVTTAGDRRRRALDERAHAFMDSLDAVLEARRDSVDELRDRADELEDSSAQAGAGERRALQQRADSVRGAMRQVVDRLKVDEARRQQFEAMHEFSRQELDSLAGLGERLRDSVQTEVAKQLRQMQIELQHAEAARQRTGAPATGRGAAASAPVTVEAPAPPKPPAPTSRP